MPDVADKRIRSVLGRSLITAAVFSEEYRRNIIRILSDVWRGILGFNDWYQPVVNEVRTASDLISENLHYMQSAIWIEGFKWADDKIPEPVRELVRDDSPRIIFRPPQRPVEPPPMPPLFEGAFGEDGPPEIRFPKIEEAAKRLIERDVMNREDFDAASEFYKNRAFTVAGDIETETIQKIRNTLAEDIQQGTSLKGFRNRLNERLDGSPIGGAHLETVYRTNAQAAFRDGRETLLANPVVNEMFPYQEYIHIGDDRVRPEHAALSTLGLNGTGVYRRDDPFWDQYTPPWSFNCRCTVNVLTIDKAARRGVKEAQRWLDTGKPPESPEYRIGNIPFESNPGFGSRGRTGVMA